MSMMQEKMYINVYGCG
ncbi:hypothetical protein CL2_02030 [Anaerostipes hadrus]|uniref:Uncharacterized protein n=1 Tax=Anaerostipes hadrus TaxID=649756 RepID=D4MXG2_ANAHA|nr:hypothetical protein CL2_02030 [Anaerostipes hadrus]